MMTLIRAFILISPFYIQKLRDDVSADVVADASGRLRVIAMAGAARIEDFGQNGGEHGPNREPTTKIAGQADG
ncbi:hypothetical protein EJ077_20030 [Mesorhizobium sp. M8A.F.Ca.ET.057.01.1.1]|uniref:hypothetical protein n=1 Tax=Mesorhizobium sp. M8A.F.Ca.ET.057.01.1.1 TaxID=2493679 RepID=UPI000F750CA6|nr:hypothetical protein [Mesorhizobium sp. M8A.F.Ca.ET.057.01.1.1]AZO55467.1 hypothetical protein EJ077_20030 [Mesorhizobium sp. M8A.F.Ca.ET.057.01.1.1]